MPIKKVKKKKELQLMRFGIYEYNHSIRSRVTVHVHRRNAIDSVQHKSVK
jgi:hypothetical protein